ncbi:MAG: glycosyltransferase family 4 protein [Gammaproteobacteria bacterium]
MIISPMPTGNGAYVVHKALECRLGNYKVIPYHPYRTLLPLTLSPLGRFLPADLIHTTPDYAIFHQQRNIPLVLTFHNYVLDSFMGKYSNLFQHIHYRTDLKWFTSSALQRAHTLTAVSHFTAELIKREMPLKKEIRVIYNGVDEQYFVPAKQISKSSPLVKVLFCGNLSRRKGAHWLIPIADRLDAGIEIQYTTGMRNENSLANHARLSSLGRIPYEEMPTVYQQADILLFPTVREGLSLAAAEAMACGLPVVATHCSSLPELIDQGKGGFLCPPGDVQSFADSINRLASDSNLRRKMGEYNRSIIEQNFTLQRMIREYKNLFEEVLDSR